MSPDNGITFASVVKWWSPVWFAIICYTILKSSPTCISKIRKDVSLIFILCKKTNWYTKLSWSISWENYIGWAGYIDLPNICTVFPFESQLYFIFVCKYLDALHDFCESHLWTDNILSYFLFITCSAKQQKIHWHVKTKLHFYFWQTLYSWSHYICVIKYACSVLRIYGHIGCVCWFVIKPSILL